MADSDLTEISSEFVRTALIETIEKHLKTKMFEYKLNSAAKGGDNFIGIVQRVSYNKKTANGQCDDEIEKSKLILKTAPTNVARRENFFSRICFLREIYLYDEVLPFFKEFQQSKGIIAEEDGFSQYPKCYHWSNVEPYECLMLEDLTVSDFTMIDRRRETITADHVNLVMKSLGQFHAISFAVKDQQPEKFNKITPNLSEIFTGNPKPEMIEYLESLKLKVLEAVSSEEDAHLVERLKALYVRKQIDISAECVNSELAEPYSVICHGDCWTNNTMFKYDKDHKPIDACLIDWQISRYASPVTDLLYYLFCCITKDIRDKHYDEFLKTYHSSLSEFLKRLGSDPSKLFPYDVMLEHLQRFGKFGMVMATMLLPVITLEEGVAPDLDELAKGLSEKQEIDVNVFMTDNSKDEFNKRVRDVVIDMVRLGYL